VRLNAAQLDAAIERYLLAAGTGANVDIVTAGPVDVRGRVATTTASPERPAVLRLERLEPGAIVEAIEGDHRTVLRVFCDHGVLEPQEAGLVILALAPGVSATDVQALVGPTLKITHEVAEMVLN